MTTQPIEVWKTIQAAYDAAGGVLSDDVPVRILEEWASQFQLQPDESDEICAHEIFAESILWEKMDVNEKRAAQLIARHTAAKVAEAVKRTQELAGKPVLASISDPERDYIIAGLEDKVAAEEERGWNRGAAAMKLEAERTCISRRVWWVNKHKFWQMACNACVEAIRDLPLPTYKKEVE